MDIETRIAEMQKLLDAFKEEYKQQLNKPTLEVGKWYKDINSECIFNYVSDNNSYGIAYGSWVSSSWLVAGDGVNWKTRPATDKEVEEALIKEAEKRGFKEGVEVKYPLGDYSCSGILIKKYNHTYNSEQNWFYYHNILVFADGKWAEIIKRSNTRDH